MVAREQTALPALLDDDAGGRDAAGWPDQALEVSRAHLPEDARDGGRAGVACRRKGEEMGDYGDVGEGDFGDGTRTGRWKILAPGGRGKPLTLVSIHDSFGHAVHSLRDRGDSAMFIYDEVTALHWVPGAGWVHDDGTKATEFESARAQTLMV